MKAGTKVIIRSKDLFDGSTGTVVSRAFIQGDLNYLVEVDVDWVRRAMPFWPSELVATS